METLVALLCGLTTPRLPSPAACSLHAAPDVAPAGPEAQALKPPRPGERGLAAV